MITDEQLDALRAARDAAQAAGPQAVSHIAAAEDHVINAIKFLALGADTAPQLDSGGGGNTDPDK